MSRKNKTTEVVITDPEQIADLARRLREHGKIDFAEIVESRTEVLVQKRGDKVVGIDLPLDERSEAAMRRAYGGTVLIRRGGFTEEVVTNRERIADLARRFRECGDVGIAEILEVATEVLVVLKKGRMHHLEIPSHALPESRREAALKLALKLDLDRSVSSRGSRH
jgi:predicted nuclease with RNAse H fold